mgnify:CR=1 FL=1
MNMLGTTIRACGPLAAQLRPELRARRARHGVDRRAIKCGLFLAAALAVVGMARRSRITPSVAALLIVGITVGRSLTIDRKIIDLACRDRARVRQQLPRNAGGTLLRSDSTQFRVSPLQLGRQPAGRVRHRASVLGYHPAKPRLYQAFVDTVGIQTFETLQLLNVKYILADATTFPADAKDVVLRHDGR